MKLSIIPLFLAMSSLSLAMILPFSLSANTLTDSTITEADVSDDGGSIGGAAGGRELLGTSAGLKEMFDGGQSARFRTYVRPDSIQPYTTLSVQWPYVYSNYRVSRNAGKYGYQYVPGKVAVFNISTGQKIGNNGGNYEVTSVTANGINIQQNSMMGHYYSVQAIFAQHGGYRTDSMSCSHNMITVCNGKNAFIVHWVK